MVAEKLSKEKRDGIVKKIWPVLKVDSYLSEEMAELARERGGNGDPLNYLYDGEILIDEVAEAMVEVGLYPDFASVPYEANGIADLVTHEVYRRLRRIQYTENKIVEAQEELKRLREGL